MKAGTGETRAISASSGLRASSSATMLANVMTVWNRPKAALTIMSGRDAASCCARRSRSYDADSSKKGRSSLAACSMTISWTWSVIRSCRSCCEMFRTVLSREFRA